LTTVLGTLAAGANDTLPEPPTPPLAWLRPLRMVDTRAIGAIHLPLGLRGALREAADLHNEIERQNSQ
jgi:hypothetical protein